MTAPTAPAATPGPVRATATPLAVGGVRAKTLRLGDPVPFPEDVVLYATDGLYEGPSPGLRRYYRDPGGALRTDDLWAVARPQSDRRENRGVVGVVAGPSPGDLAAAICHGFCYASWDPVSVVRSSDGGVTWEEVTLMDEGSWGTLVGIVGESLVVRPVVADRFGQPMLHPTEATTTLAIAPEVDANDYIFVGYLSGAPVVLSLAEDARTLWDLTVGAPRLEIPSPPNFRIDAGGLRLTLRGGADELTVTWYGDGPESLLAFMSPSDGAVRAVYQWHRDDGVSWVQVTHWLSATVAIGSARFRASDFAPDTSADHVRGLPAIIDFAAGTVSPIEEFLPFVTSKPGGPVPVAAGLGLFARVVESGTCLNVRAQPAADAAIVGFRLQRRRATEDAGGGSRRTDLARGQDAAG